MRTRSVIIFGFVVLFAMFGISSFLQWEFSQEIKEVSEYHRNMSIPAITLLQQIELDFAMMHNANIQTIMMKPTGESMQTLEAIFLESKNSLEQNIQKYNDLTFIKKQMVNL